MKTPTEKMATLFFSYTQKALHKAELSLALVSVLTLDCLICSIIIVNVSSLQYLQRSLSELLVALCLLGGVVVLFYGLEMVWHAYKQSSFSKNRWVHRSIAVFIMVGIVKFAPCCFHNISSAHWTPSQQAFSFLGTCFVIPLLLFAQKHIFFRTDMQTQDYGEIGEGFDERESQQACIWQSKAYKLLPAILPAIIGAYFIVFQNLFPYHFQWAADVWVTQIVLLKADPIFMSTWLLLPILIPLGTIVRFLPDFLAQWYYEKPMSYGEALEKS